MNPRFVKRPSNPKISSSKQINTITNKFFDKDVKLPPIQNSFRTTTKLPQIKRQQSVCTRKQTQMQTTLTQSTLFQSYYNTNFKDWIKPSDYLKDIKDLNLFGEQQLDIKKYQIKLNQSNKKNVSKIQALFQLVSKWNTILKKALFYVTSEKSMTDKLSEEVKFWKVLSKKFDQLQYQFNDKKTTQLVSLMFRIIKTNPQQRKTVEQFIQLKQQVVNMTHRVKKLYLYIEETVAGKIQKFEQSSDIAQTLTLLKNILINFQMIYQQHHIMENRMRIIYNKMDICLIKKLLAAPLYPHQLTNISSLKEKYGLLDKALSVYSYLLTIMEEDQNNNFECLIGRASHGRQVVGNLLQILAYFEFLYNKKDVYQFNKLSVYLKFNIYDIQQQKQWNDYMDTVRKSMQLHKFEQ